MTQYLPLFIHFRLYVLILDRLDKVREPHLFGIHPHTIIPQGTLKLHTVARVFACTIVPAVVSSGNAGLLGCDVEDFLGGLLVEGAF